MVNILQVYEVVYKLFFYVLYIQYFIRYMHTEVFLIYTCYNIIYKMLVTIIVILFFIGFCMFYCLGGKYINLTYVI